MKKIKLQFQNSNGNVEAETEVVIGDKDILVIQYPDSFTNLQLSKLLDRLPKMLEKGLVVVPSSIEFKVIKNT